MHVLMELSCLGSMNNLLLSLVESEDFLGGGMVVAGSLGLINYSLNLRSPSFITILRGQLEPWHCVLN